MKAIKLTKIIWNLDTEEPDKRIKLLETLPTKKGFTVEDEFDVAERVPVILKKKYGYDIKDFSFTECRIAETVDDLLYLCMRAGMKKKRLYKEGGKLSAFGEELLNNLKTDIRRRLDLEFKGVSEYDMPKHLDEVMLGVEKVSGISWEKHTIEELMNPIMNKIWDVRAANIKDEYDRMMDELESENEE